MPPCFMPTLSSWRRHNSWTCLTTHHNGLRPMDCTKAEMLTGPLLDLECVENSIVKSLAMLWKGETVESFHAHCSSRARLGDDRTRTGRDTSSAAADDTVPASGGMAVCALFSGSRTMAVRSFLVRAAAARLAGGRCDISGREDMRDFVHGSGLRILLVSSWTNPGDCGNGSGDNSRRRHLHRLPTRTAEIASFDRLHWRRAARSQR